MRVVESVMSNPSAFSSAGFWGYRSYREHLNERFPGQRIRKLCLSAGFTCPNLDGTIGRHGCTYCNNRGFVPKIARHGDLSKQWEKGRKALRRRHGKIDGFIAYFQAFSNTYAPLEVLYRVYNEIPQLFPECVGASIGTRPDCLPDDVLDYLSLVAERTFLTVEIGLQSDRNDILRRTNRGHSVEAFLDAVGRAADCGFEICVHFILGFPEEGDDAPERMGLLAASLPIQSVKLHNLHVMKGTALAQQMKTEPFTTPSQTSHLQAVARFVKKLRPDQSVQRVTADAPDSLLIGDPWCHDKQGFLKKLKKILRSDSSKFKLTR
jgi:uncharacterized protein